MGAQASYVKTRPVSLLGGHFVSTCVLDAAGQVLAAGNKGGMGGLQGCTMPGTVPCCQHLAAYTKYTSN